MPYIDVHHQCHYQLHQLLVHYACYDGTAIIAITKQPLAPLLIWQPLLHCCLCAARHALTNAYKTLLLPLLNTNLAKHKLSHRQVQTSWPISILIIAPIVHCGLQLVFKFKLFATHVAIKALRPLLNRF